MLAHRKYQYSIVSAKININSAPKKKGRPYELCDILEDNYMLKMQLNILYESSVLSVNSVNKERKNVHLCKIFAINITIGIWCNSNL